MLAVGAQPSVIRAGIAGALGSIAWLSARQRDRWHFLLVGALVLLAWSPYNLLDAGFQLSFAAVVAIFVAVPLAKRLVRGLPAPARGSPEVLAVSLACGVATAPILWLQFGRIPVYSVPANALAAPVVAPLLGLSFAAAVADSGLHRLRRSDRRRRTAGSPPTWPGAPTCRRASGRLVSSAPAAIGLLLLSRGRRRKAPPEPAGALTMLAARGGRARSRPTCSPAATGRRSSARSAGCASASARTRIERLSARDATGDDAVAACNAMGLFAAGGRLVLVDEVERWKAADAKAVAEYLAAPAPDTVLALVGEELRKDSPLAKALREEGRGPGLRGLEARAAEVGRRAVRTPRGQGDRRGHAAR